MNNTRIILWVDGEETELSEEELSSLVRVLENLSPEQIANRTKPWTINVEYT